MQRFGRGKTVAALAGESLSTDQADSSSRAALSVTGVETEICGESSPVLPLAPAGRIGYERASCPSHVTCLSILGTWSRCRDGHIVLYYHEKFNTKIIENRWVFLEEYCTY